ncbi:MAG: hypothetical protein A2W85_18665 [Bacteroidetes bacterium GWF2_41_31]|nr:MAG: hypothetical protein A2W85_18665 [Bacteroidetes bacterium GWF2_41_31]OFZ09118.1 MAG: hypothetical protein A2338_07400 [Bacteroidetes bacterium RIFOXYB12_FULL_41_6]
MRTKINKPMLILLAVGLIFLASCQRVTIRVESIPQNTPKGQPIYITGNFNDWDPGDAKYQLSLAADSNYYITLPPGFGKIDYKFTRGDWTTVEKDICGDEINNRELFTADEDTVSNNIESWNDLDPANCPRLTIVIEDVPENTPEDDVIALASNLNSWDPDDASITKITSSGTRYITIDRPPGVNNLEYKLTRGSLSSSESDEFGNEVSNRTMEFGKKDTIKVSVKGWTDKPENKPVRVVLLISHLPKNTPGTDPVFFASNLNSWAPGDKNYQFQRNNEGQLFYSLPRKKFMLDYKITRGDWSTVEVDKNGYDISNRQTNLENADTVVLTVNRWKDMGGSGDDDMTIILDRVPESTPENAKLYISGSFNDWDPGKLRYKFWKDATGRYFINLPRRNGDFEFRITRGSWESTQVDANGSDIRPYQYNYQDFDTLTLAIDNWKDIPEKEMDQVTIVIDKIPANTPVNDQIFLAPDFNGWNPEDRQLIFGRLTDGRPVLTFATHGNKMDFKITRGGWHTVEVNQYGEEIPNRTLYVGFADTVYLEIDRWKDR